MKTPNPEYYQDPASLHIYYHTQDRSILPYLRITPSETAELWAGSLIRERYKHYTPTVLDVISTIEALKNFNNGRAITAKSVQIRTKRIKELEEYLYEHQ